MGTVREIGPNSHPLKLTDEERENAEEFAKNVVMKSGVSFVFYPLAHIKTLAQLGHEPYPLSIGRTFGIFGREAYILPNFFVYGRNLYREFGFKALYIGVAPSFLSMASGAITSFYTTIYLDRLYPNLGGKLENKDKDERQLSDSQSFRRALRSAIRESVAKVFGTIAARPFQVIMIRQIAQTIGSETKYTGVLSSLRIIGNEEGVKGYFAGLIPQLIGELLMVWGVHGVIYLIDRTFVTFESEVDEGLEEEEDAKMKAMKSKSRNVINMIVPVMVNAFVYPYHVCSTILAVSGSSLAQNVVPYCPPIFTWQDCWNHLARTKQLKRGASAIFRAHKGAVSVGAGGKLHANVAAKE